MTKYNTTKLDKFADELEQWFDTDMTLEEAQERLAALGCRVSLSKLWRWRSVWQRKSQEQLFIEDIAVSADQCTILEKTFASHPPPEFATLIKLHRVLILNLANEGNVEPDKLRLVNRMMTEVYKFFRLEQLAELTRLEERRVRISEEKVAQADQAQELAGSKLSPEEQAARLRQIFKVKEPS